MCLVLPYVAVGDFVQDLSARPQVLLKSSGLIRLLGLLLQVDLRPLVLRCLVLVASLVLGLLAARLELSWMPEFLGSSNIFRSSGSYWRAIGSLDNSSSVSDLPQQI